MGKISRKFGLLLPVMVILVGCTRWESGRQGAADSGATSAQTHAYLLLSEPPGARGVAEVRQSIADEEDVVMVGRVGGDKEPFVNGLAAFLIVDPALLPCAPDCGCPTPWDYCCDLNELPKYKAMVKVVDSGSSPVETDARELLGIKELTTVVVQGKAHRDEAGNLTILAQGVYVRPET